MLIWASTSYLARLELKKPPMWEALEFLLSFLHRNSASEGGGHKKESKKGSLDFFHRIKLKRSRFSVNQNLVNLKIL
ncbi:hypothetical protein CXF86_02995 [Shewanella sp. GutCb]|nr:hypothetical protein CXF86_02995 [Shewanella sp. GutCb]PKH57566.1 hypothetical protein CXF84_08070 [Shewanella sp. Bg11-22]